MRAVERILDKRGTNLPQNSKTCILEALSITMSSYNGQFSGSYLLRLMVQLLGAQSQQVSQTFLGQFIWMKRLDKGMNICSRVTGVGTEMTLGILRKTVMLKVQNGLRTILMKIYLEIR